MNNNHPHIPLESLVSLSSDATEPLYQQLVQQLRLLIVTGRVLPSSRLPSSRQLAVDMGVSRTTCTSAYQQLLTEGLLISRQGAGIFVNTSLPAALRQGKTKPLALMDGLPASHSTDNSNGGFSSGPDARNFPFPLWARCLAKAWRRPEPSLLQDQHPGGYEPLRRSLSHYLYMTRGVYCSPAQIVITAGQRDSLSLISKALMQRGDHVYMENPGYPLQRQVVNSLGLTAQWLEVDKEGAKLPYETNPATRLAIIGPNRQYPLGIAMSGPRKLAWLNYAQNHNCWLLEDDYDSEFTYERHKTDALMSLDQNQRVILLGSFSKLMFQGFRLGYLVLPEPLIEDVLEAQQELGSMASLHIQPALSLFVTDRSFNPHLGRMRRLYRHRRDVLCGLINQHLSQWLYAIPPESGMHLVAFCHPTPDGQTIDDQAIVVALKTHGVTAFALSKHYAGHGPSGFCLGFSGCDDAQLTHNVIALKQVLLATGYGTVPTQGVGTGSRELSG
jgi:GntR family transcriptional regulator/MocR family aminotransferase